MDSTIDQKQLRKVTMQPETVDRIGGGLVNVILGALILWVGQTTFRHAGLLASVDERYESIGYQFKTVDDRNEKLRQRIEQVVTDISERTRSRFTREDGAKLQSHINDLNNMLAGIERQLVERVTGLQLKVIAMETRGINHEELARLRNEVQQLRGMMARGSSPTLVRGGPVYLPPVTQRQ